MLHGPGWLEDVRMDEDPSISQKLYRPRPQEVLDDLKKTFRVKPYVDYAPNVLPLEYRMQLVKAMQVGN